MAPNTREKIMMTAIEMFNEKSSTNVSTVQLANELKMSPGNLYYYFNNKEHIIRDIWLELISPKLGDLFYEDGLENDLDKLMVHFTNLSQLTYEYRFFYLDLPTLLQNDPEIRKVYGNRGEDLRHRMERIITVWSENGVMDRMEEPFAKPLLIQNCWVLSQTAITYLHLLNEDVTAKDVHESIVQRFYGLLYPFFSKESHEKMLNLFRENGFSSM